MKAIGPQIRKIRVTRQLTLQEVAAAACITPAKLKEIEKAAEPSKSEVKKVCKAMGITREMLALFCIELKDVAKEKQGVYKALSPLSKKIVSEFLMKKEKND